MGAVDCLRRYVQNQEGSGILINYRCHLFWKTAVFHEHAPNCWAFFHCTVRVDGGYILDGTPYTNILHLYKRWNVKRPDKSQVYLSVFHSASGHNCVGLQSPSSTSVCSHPSHTWIRLIELLPLKKSHYKTYDSGEVSKFLAELYSKRKESFKFLRPIPPQVTKSESTMIKLCEKLAGTANLREAAKRGKYITILHMRHKSHWKQFLDSNNLGNEGSAQFQMWLYNLIAVQGHQLFLSVQDRNVTNMKYNMHSITKLLQQSGLPQWKVVKPL